LIAKDLYSFLSPYEPEGREFDYRVPAR